MSPPTHRRRAPSPKRSRLLAASSALGFATAIAANSIASAVHGGTPVLGNGTTTTPTTQGTTQGTQPRGVRQATGALEQYGYGQLGVDVTVNGTRITGLSVTTLSTAESYSQQLAGQVIPILKNEVLAAQSTQVSGVTGATYTSQAYLSSVQSALDALGV